MARKKGPVFAHPVSLAIERRRLAAAAEQQASRERAAANEARILELRKALTERQREIDERDAAWDDMREIMKKAWAAWEEERREEEEEEEEKAVKAEEGREEKVKVEEDGE